MFEDLIAELFSPENVAARINAMSDINTKVMDDIYPSGVRGTHPFATIGIAELTEIAKAVPVVRRGTQSVSIGGGTGSISFIEPQPIDVSRFVTAKELNDLKLLDPNAQNTWLDGKLVYMRNTVRATSEALSCQSLTGAINYPMKIDGGFDSYQISFGTVATITPTKVWDAAGSTIGDVNDTLNKMSEALEDDGFASDIEFRIGALVESFLVGLIGSLGNDTRIIAKVDADYIYIGKHKLKMSKGRYYNPQTKAYVNAIGDKVVQAIDMAGGFSFKYLAIDDIDAGLAATPLFINPKKADDPSGYKIIAKSTPLPIPVPSAMNKSTVLA